jgi:hypothetical protein
MGSLQSVSTQRAYPIQWQFLFPEVSVSRPVMDRILVSGGKVVVSSTMFGNCHTYPEGNISIKRKKKNLER